MQSASRPIKKSPREFARAMKTSHPLCDDIINKADTRYEQLAASLTQQENDAADERLKLNSIIQQAKTEKQRAFDEVRRLRAETSRLQKQLDEVDSTPQDHVPRTDLNDILKELHGITMSLANNIGKKMNESDYAFLSTCLPGTDLDNTNWEGQDEDFGMVENGLLMDDPAAMMPSAEAEDLACIPPYATMN